MNHLTTRRVTTAAMTGALYAALSLFGSVFGITFGPVQCRFAEALCVLPFFFPETVWGLFVGCLITNLLSPYGFLDILLGSAATLIAALLTSRCRRKWLAPLPPVLLNALLVGGLIAWQQTGFSAAFLPAFLLQGSCVGLGELLACYGLGSLLLWQLPRHSYFRERIEQRRQ